jgi:hypothetical protein
MDKAMHSEFEGHTPGEWRSDESEYSQYVFGPDGEMICEMRGWGYLTGNRRNLSEDEALKIQSRNCKLIAAAPDLLKENQSLRSELQKQKELSKDVMRFYRWMTDEGWQEHSSGRYFFKLEYASQWPPPEKNCATEGDLIRLWNESLIKKSKES